jgi:hypothetical protein
MHITTPEQHTVIAASHGRQSMSEVSISYPFPEKNFQFSIVYLRKYEAILLLCRGWDTLRGKMYSLKFFYYPILDTVAILLHIFLSKLY